MEHYFLFEFEERREVRMRKFDQVRRWEKLKEGKKLSLNFLLASWMKRNGYFREKNEYMNLIRSQFVPD
jgi:hypothetical protein